MRCRLALAALVLAGCDRPPHGRCELSTAQRVALASGHHFDGSALVTRGAGALALYSDASGLWARALSPEGAARAEARRVGARCAGGVAASALRDGRVFVACSRPAADGAGALVTLVLSPALAPLGERTIAAIDAASRGVAVSALPGSVAVAYHDGGPAEHRVWLAHVPVDVRAEVAPPRALSKAGTVASAPSLAARGGALYAAYVESDFALDAQRATLHVLDTQGAHELTVPLHHHDAAPELAVEGDVLALTYRDRPTVHARVEQFVARLAHDLHFIAEPTRIGRASGSGVPQLALCGERTYAAAPIEHGSELYVIFHGLDQAFQPLEANHQCYATERSYVGAQATCAGNALVALVSEETDPSAGPAELLGMRFSCR